MRKYIPFINPPSNQLRKIIFILFDIISFAGAIILAFAATKTPVDPGKLYFIVLIFLALKLFISSLFRLYDISWRNVSLHEMASIVNSSLISELILISIFALLGSRFSIKIPLVIFASDFIIGLLFSSAFKISKRMYLEVMRQSVGKSELQRTIIIGAGSSAEQFIRDNNRAESRRLNVIGLVDDDPLKQGLYFQGVKVIGSTEQLCWIISKHSVDTVLISVLNADRNFHRKIYNLCRECGVKHIKVISTINDISETIKVRINDVRDIDLSDLIGRQAVSINTSLISSYLKGKRILITGAAGSIGSEISRQVLYYEPEEVAIVDMNESDLADLELQLKKMAGEGKLNSPERIRMFLCDISNKRKVDRMFSQFRPEVVFHAAAYKHVPVMERFPEEAVRVNIVGTHILANASNEYGVENFILISTDKAVNPTSIMGASKRIAEYIVTGIGRKSAANFVAVRFGNVLGSRGSVLPIFIEQLRHGGPITITHPEMRRYFMSIPEAVALVLQAAVTGGSGDVFVLDMGEPVKIVDLATELILLNNMIPGRDIKIEYTGIREGEKLYEEVLGAEEGIIATGHKKIYKSRLVCRLNSESIDEMVEEFSSLLGYGRKSDWREMFRYYVPTYTADLKYDPYDTELNRTEDIPLQANLNT